MGKYRLVFMKSMAKDLRSIPGKDVARILKVLSVLSADPRARGCEKLTSQERYRMRKGPYRIVYEIRDDESLVVIIKVAHRRDVY
jgi:mRNA interferase RelE/StbE